MIFSVATKALNMLMPNMAWHFFFFLTNEVSIIREQAIWEKKLAPVQKMPGFNSQPMEYY